MGLLGGEMDSPIQRHPVHIANDLLWVTGELETLGNPHNYVNQDGMDYLRVSQAHIIPWAFTGLPSSHNPEVVVARAHTQFLMFPAPESMEQFRKPMRVEPLIYHLPLAVIRGSAPFLSEAKTHNFLDFWKGDFFPVIDAEIHYLADGPELMPDQAQVLYINRNVLQSYLEG